MNFAPPRPTGSTPQARFEQWVWDSIHQLAPQDAPGVLKSATTRGVMREAQKNSGDTASDGEARYS